MTVALEMRDVIVSLGLMVAIDSNKLSDLQLGSLMNTDRTLSCFLTALHSLKVTDLAVGGYGIT